MRRPSPLPPTGRAAPAADSASEPDVETSARPLGTGGAATVVEGAAARGGVATGSVTESASDADEQPSTGSDSAAAEDRPAAPVIPLGSAERPAELDTAAGQGPAVETPDAADPRVGIREVWRAARARRRALRAEVRRFTVRQRRRRAVWLGVAASIVVLVLLTLGAAYSPLFAVETITVEGASQLDADAVEQALADQLGTPMPLVDESAVKAALVTFPLVESYSLEARPPHELVVRIVERTPVGSIESLAGYTLVDAAGVALSTTPQQVAGSPLLTVDGGTDSKAFEAVGQVMRSLPAAIRAQVTAVAASTPDDVTLTLGGTNTQVVWGSAEDSALKAVVLQSTMAARPPESVSVYDVSSPRAVVVS
ncbi:FtsQ-type POTRA domain-containing protein [Microbacterium pumilum]|uniref:POTRA domain-containing protein n=1 Tax=Microbacterium pumilum TaxID=344165 RepID=A0ABN2SKA1_9MICO